jgi:hypothetical protein
MPAKRKSATKRQTSTSPAPARIWDKSFLAALRVHGNVSVACHVCEIDRSTVYRRRNTDDEFRQAWDDAMEEAGDWLEHEARRRAEEGTLKPIYFKGELVGFEREYSDTLMGMMLKGIKPDKYGDKITIKVKPEWLAVFDEAGMTPGDILENFVQRYAKRKQEVNNAS